MVKRKSTSGKRRNYNTTHGKKYFDGIGNDFIRALREYFKIKRLPQRVINENRRKFVQFLNSPDYKRIADVNACKLQMNARVHCAKRGVKTTRSQQYQSQHTNESESV